MPGPRSFCSDVSAYRTARRGVRERRPDANLHRQWLHGCTARVEGSYTIFEGTSEIQRLVIARAISGLHIR
jgi:alkylation response protein AidB-like acyl-CoA dehydrogenase